MRDEHSSNQYWTGNITDANSSYFNKIGKKLCPDNKRLLEISKEI